MATLETTLLRQSAIRDNVRSIGMLKFSTGILVFVLMSTLALYLVRDVGFIPAGFPYLLLVVAFCFFPLFYVLTGFFELASGKALTAKSSRWSFYSNPQCRVLVVILSVMGLIVTLAAL